MMPGKPTTLQPTECDWQILGAFLILLIDSFSSFISRLLLACFILWPFCLPLPYANTHPSKSQIQSFLISNSVPFRSLKSWFLKFSICTLSVNVTFQVCFSECCRGCSWSAVPPACQAWRLPHSDPFFLLLPHWLWASDLCSPSSSPGPTLLLAGLSGLFLLSHVTPTSQFLPSGRNPSNRSVPTHRERSAVCTHFSSMTMSPLLLLHSLFCKMDSSQAVEMGATTV